MFRFAYILLFAFTTYSCKQNSDVTSTEASSNLQNGILKAYVAGNFAECARKAQLLYKEASAQTDLELEAFAAHYAAKSLLKLGQIDTAYYYLDQTQRRYLNGNGTTLRLIESYIESATLLNVAEDQAKAKRMALSALELLDNLPGEIKLYCAAYDALTDIYLALGNLPQALRCQKIVSNRLRQSKGILLFENQCSLAKLFLLQKNPEQALRYLQWAGQDIGQLSLKADRLLLFYNQFAHCYQMLGNNQMVKYYDGMAELLSSKATDAIRAAILVDIALRTTKNHNLQLLNKAHDIAVKAKLKKERLLVYDAMVKINAPEAPRYAAAFVDLFDSLENKGHQMRNRVARITFGNDQLLSEIGAANSSRKYFIIFGVSLILLLITVTFVIFERIRSREIALLTRQDQLNDQVMHLIANQQKEVDQQRTQQKIQLANSINEEVLHALDHIKIQLRKEPPVYGADGEFTEIKAIQDVEQHVRSIAHALNGAIFSENISFNGLLHEKINALKGKLAVNLYLEVSPTVNWDDFSVDSKIDLYIILEDILNLAVISQPKNVFITITSDVETLKLIFLDDGNGSDFTNGKLKSDWQEASNRISRNKGNCNIKRRPGKGTTIIVTLPLKN